MIAESQGHPFAICGMILSAFSCMRKGQPGSCPFLEKVFLGGIAKNYMYWGTFIILSYPPIIYKTYFSQI